MGTPFATNFNDFLDLELFRNIGHSVSVQPGLVVPTPTATISLFWKETDTVPAYQAACTVVSIPSGLQVDIAPPITYPLGYYFYTLWLNSAGTPYTLVTKGRARVRP